LIGGPQIAAPVRTPEYGGARVRHELRDNCADDARPGEIVLRRRENIPSDRSAATLHRAAHPWPGGTVRLAASFCPAANCLVMPESRLHSGLATHSRDVDFGFAD
jgi:hypothetical protein